jgi:hypothetical protein
MHERNNRVLILLLPTTFATLLTGCLIQSGTEEGGPRDEVTPPSEGEKTGSVSSAVGVASCLSGTDTLKIYARKCTAAMDHVEIPNFDCDVGSTEPPRQGAVGALACDAPNVLNGVCDKGSKFHMLHRNVSNDGIYIAAHCRKQELGAGEFGDIAVIEYNAKTGATCFFQALASDVEPILPATEGVLPGVVLSPKLGTSLDGSGTYPWRTPANTASIGCIKCHDNGPFVRSPYLAQLGDLWPAPGGVADTNYLPGTIATETFWNGQMMPYKFVGLDYQKWEAYSVSKNNNSATASTCTNCHRMGVSQKLVTGSSPQRFPTSGSSLDFGLQATAPSGSSHYQSSKNPYSASSPIWMTPGNVDATPWPVPGVPGLSLDPVDPGVNTAHAQHIADCATEFATSSADVPTLSASCHINRFARGDTCMGPTTEVIINGTTKSDTTDYTSNIEIPLGCKDQADCPPGFYYWTSLHGPFYQNSTAAVAIASPSFRGSYERIAAVGGNWVLQQKLNATDLVGAAPSPGAPGGAISGINFSRIASIPIGSSCGGGVALSSVVDTTGGSASTSTTLFSPASSSLGILSGFIGNVTTTRTSSLQIFDTSTATKLTQTHIVAAPPAKLWFTGEAWTNTCSSWAPSTYYAAQNIQSNDDVQLVTAAVAPHVICYLTGIGGNWATSRPDGSGGMDQPYATIYQGLAGETRLKVWPPVATDADGITAYASCLNID